MVGMKLKIRGHRGNGYDSALNGIRLYCNDSSVPATREEGRQVLRSKEGGREGDLRPCHELGNSLHASCWRHYVGTEKGIVGVWVRSQELQQEKSHWGTPHCAPGGDDMAATDVRFLDESGKQHKPGEKTIDGITILVHRQLINQLIKYLIRVKLVSCGAKLLLQKQQKSLLAS